MTPADGLRLAGGALRGHRLRTGLSLLGVAVGVMSVVLLTSLGEGARRYVTGEFAALGSNLLIITPGRTETTGFAPPIGGAPHDLTLEDAAAVRRQVPRVRAVAPMAVGSATARVGDLTRDVMVIGTTAEWEDVRRVELQVGRFLPGDAAGHAQAVCVIGARVQSELFRGRSALGQMLRIGDERFRVIGVNAQRGSSLGTDLDDVVLVPVERHLRMFNLTSLFRLLVEVGAHDDLPVARAAAIALLRQRHGDEEDVTVLTQDSMLATFSSLLNVLTLALTGIAAISLTVAGIGIMNVMLVSVSERTREIGLMKALGAPAGLVMRVFLTEAAILSACGGLLGLAAAAALTAAARAIYPSFPMQPPPWAMPLALVVSVCVGVVFGVLPARRAARLDPIAALARR